MPSTAPFTLVIADLAPNDDPHVITHLAAELNRIVDTANRCAVSARNGSAPTICVSCSGIGSAVGECASCHGRGRVA